MKLKLSDMTPALRDRVQKAMAKEDARKGAENGCDKMSHLNGAGGPISTPPGRAGEGLGALAPWSGVCNHTPAVIGRKGEPPTRALRAPNKTEAAYNRLMLGGRGEYEPLTLRLPGGSRYTPDFMTVELERLETVDDLQDGSTVHTPARYTITLHEVKGSYRFGSQGRALTAFRECAAHFPCFKFVWATRQKDGTFKVKHEGSHSHA